MCRSTCFAIGNADSKIDEGQARVSDLEAQLKQTMRTADGLETSNELQKINKELELAEAELSQSSAGAKVAAQARVDELKAQQVLAEANVRDLESEEEVRKRQSIRKSPLGLFLYISTGVYQSTWPVGMYLMGHVPYPFGGEPCHLSHMPSSTPSLNVTENPCS